MRTFKLINIIEGVNIYGPLVVIVYKANVYETNFVSLDFLVNIKKVINVIFG